MAHCCIVSKPTSIYSPIADNLMGYDIHDAVLSKLGEFSFHHIACHCAGWLVHDCVHRPKGGSGVDHTTTASAAEVSCHSVFFCHVGVDLCVVALPTTQTLSPWRRQMCLSSIEHVSCTRMLLL